MVGSKTRRVKKRGGAGDYIVLSGEALDKLRAMSAFVDTSAKYGLDATGALRINRSLLPGAAGNLLQDLAKGNKVGYVSNGKVVFDASLGYDERSLRDAMKYLLIGTPGKELDTLVENGYIGEEPVTDVAPPRAPKLAPKVPYVPKQPPPDNFFGDFLGGARRKTRKLKLKSIKPSHKKEKKWDATFIYPDGHQKVVPFGAKGMSDYTKHRDPTRKQRYLKRHSGMGESWQKPDTPGALAKWVLWNKKTLRASIADYKRRFKL
jgi:hypothetical protein